MGTTQDRAEVGPDTLSELLVLEIVKQRMSLPHAANGRPVAPSEPYVAQVLKDMAGGQSKEVPRLRAVFRCNLRDGVPIETVTRPLYLLIADLQAESAMLKREAPRPLAPLMRLETKRQSDLDIAQLAVIASPECPQAARALLVAADQYMPTLAALRESASLVAVRGLARRVIGARRSSMQLHA